MSASLGPAFGGSLNLTWSLRTVGDCLVAELCVTALGALGPSRHARARALVEVRDHDGPPEALDLVGEAQRRQPQPDKVPVTAAIGTGASSSQRRATVTPPTIALMQPSMLATVSANCSGNHVQSAGC